MCLKPKARPFMGPFMLCMLVGLFGCEEEAAESSSMTAPNPAGDMGGSEMRDGDDVMGGDLSDDDTPVAGTTDGTMGGSTAQPVGGTGGTASPSGGNDGSGSPNAGNDDTMAGTDGQPSGQIASLRANVRFKGVHRLKGDWARALALPPEELCRELDTHDCFDFVHTIALGGIDPYESQVYEASDSLAINAPLVVERVALAACGTRYDSDLTTTEGDEAVLYKDIELTEDHSIVDINSPSVDAYINRVYNRVLLRMPTAREGQTMKDFYQTLMDIPGGEKHARDWGVLTCFMVLTSTESLFY